MVSLQRVVSARELAGKGRGRKREQDDGCIHFVETKSVSDRNAEQRCFAQECAHGDCMLTFSIESNGCGVGSYFNHCFPDICCVVSSP